MRARDPLLKYPGSKRHLIHAIAPYWEWHCDRRLVELFCGSAAVSLGLRPERALLNDINPRLISFHQQLQAGLGVSQDVIWENSEEIYYAQRDIFNARKEERSPFTANLLYYLNRTCFNGLMRFNSAGQFNVPFGRYKKINYCTDFSPWQTAYREWRFQCDDFAAVDVRHDDFVYADPPYDGDFTAYAGLKFRWESQERLARFLASLPCPVLASNAATPRIVELYGALGFEIQHLNVRRSIACNGDRTPAPEVLMWRCP